MRAVWVVPVAVILLGCLSPDPVPPDLAGAIAVPWVEEVRLDGYLTPGEYEGGLALNGTFHIADGSLADGVYPFRALLGAKEAERDALRVGIEMAGLPPHTPFSKDGAWWPYYVGLFFNADQDELDSPADAIVGGVLSADGNTGSRSTDQYWNGREWLIQSEDDSGPYNETSPEGRWFIGNHNGTSMVWEFHIPFRSTLEIDGLRIEPLRSFRLMLQHVALDGASGVPFDAHSDQWPGDGPTRGAEFAASTWVRLYVAEKP